MSHPTIKLHSAPRDSAVAISAVMIPPRGPSPGHRSLRSLTPRLVYLPGAATTFTPPVTFANDSRMRDTMGFSSSSTSALSCPKRALAPPASTYPNTCFDFVFTLNATLILRYFLAKKPETKIQLLSVDWLTPWPPDPELPQFFLQALTVQTDRCRGARDIPAMIGQL